MSFTIEIKNGDVALKGNTTSIITGTQKLEQELTVWLKERYGSDRFHTNYGSTLDSYIGRVISTEAVYEIESEVSRVLQNYQALQYRRFKENPQSLSASEILAEVNRVDAEPSFDSVIVTVYYTTYRGETGSFKTNLDAS